MVTTAHPTTTNYFTNLDHLGYFGQAPAGGKALLPDLLLDAVEAMDVGETRTIQVIPGRGDQRPFAVVLDLEADGLVRISEDGL